MTPSVGFVTYLWHYLIARLLYDQLVSPLLHGRSPAVLLICAVAVAALVIACWVRARSAFRKATGRPRRRV